MRNTAFFISIALAGAAAALPGEDHWSEEQSAYEGRHPVAGALIKAGRYEEAARELSKTTTQTPGDAEAHNLLGFALRKSGKFDAAELAYAQALRLDPHHRGALEYQGELFLALSDLTAAEANLARLAALCPGGCDERAELAAAITKWREGAGE